MIEIYAPIDLESCRFEFVDDLRLPLVNRFYSSCNYRVKCGRFEKTYSLSFNSSIIAAVRLIPQRSATFLLRNLCVHPEYRHQGVASYLVRATMAALNPADSYLYALPHLQAFYVALGFKHFTPDEVPVDIREMFLRHLARKRGWILMGYRHDEEQSS